LREHFLRAGRGLLQYAGDQVSACAEFCGVALVNRDEEVEPRVRAMAAALRHRGPDKDGFLLNEPRAPGLGLACAG